MIDHCHEKQITSDLLFSLKVFTRIVAGMNQAAPLPESDHGVFVTRLKRTYL